MKVIIAIMVAVLSAVVLYLSKEERQRDDYDLPGPAKTNLVLVGTNWPPPVDALVYNKTNVLPFAKIIEIDPAFDVDGDGDEERAVHLHFLSGPTKGNRFWWVFGALRGTYVEQSAGR